MRQKILYSPNEVKTLIDSNGVVIIDTRESEDYLRGHIPGAMHAPEIFPYLSRSTPEGLADLQRTFLEIFSKAGISMHKPAIFYEMQLDGCYGCSCRGYWLLTYMGHPAAGILHSGFRGWQVAGRQIETGPVAPTPVEFAGHRHHHIMATRDDVLAAIDDPGVVLLDNRDEPEWLGFSSSPYTVDFAPRKGRIPGAIWIEWYEFMDRTGPITTFKSPEAIRALCASRGVYPDQDIIIYCFKGCRAANTYVALKLAGFQKLRVYFASWNEWARDNVPIEEVHPAG
jgi:thiosulfate/3-mercaptopyruvate sulfurtransferase